MTTYEVKMISISTLTDWLTDQLILTTLLLVHSYKADIFMLRFCRTLRNLKCLWTMNT